MYTVTQRYLSTIRNSHAFYTYADLYFNGELTKSNVPVVDGSLTVDRTQNVRRSGTVMLGDATLFPTYVQSPLAPYGAELRLYQGIAYQDGSTEVVPIGVFSIESVNQEESYSQQYAGLPQVTLADRSQALVRASFLAPVDYSGWDIHAAITALVQACFSFAVAVNFAPGVTVTGTLPGGTTFDEDRLGAIQTLCASLGAEGYFDVEGVFQVVPVPSLTQANVTPTNLLSANAASLETDGTAWVADNANTTYNGSVTSRAYIGTHSGQMTSIAAGAMAVYCNEQPAVTAGSDYDFSVTVYCTLALTGTLEIDWKNAADSILSHTSTTFMLNAAQWTQLALVDQPAAAGAVKANVVLTVNAGAAGQVANWDNAIFSSSNDPTTPVWTIDASTPAAIAAGASPAGALVTANRGVSRVDCYNAAAVYGTASGSDPQPVGMAFDTDPRSPTYWGLGQTSGPSVFGHAVQRIQNSAVTTTAQALAAAEAALANSLGLARSLSFTALLNPALEAGDIIQAIYADGLIELHILDSFTLPLNASGTTGFTGTTRTLTYQLTGGT